MHDADLLRYARHILLDALGIEGQQRIQSARVLIVGAGGLGSPAALYLAAAGIGTIHIVDHDVVDLGNLQRQIAHNTDRLGQTKVASAAQAMAAINPGVRVHTYAHKATASWLEQVVTEVDVVLDCCDNFQTRHAVNAACVKARKPLVSGAAIRLDGQISVYDTRAPAPGPCYACLFPPQADFAEVQCATMGVLGPLVGIIGTMQATETLKIIADVGTSLKGRLMMLDARHMEWTTLQTQRDMACPVCASANDSAKDHANPGHFSS